VKLNAMVIHSSSRNMSHFAHCDADQVICLAGQEALHDANGSRELSSSVRGWVISAPPRFEGSIPEGTELPVYQIEPFITDEARSVLGPLSDTSPLALALGVAAAFGFEQVLMAGFDGYSVATTSQQELAREVQELINAFRRTFHGVDLCLVTPTGYDVPTTSLYGLLAELTPC
jgi:hypothetical protein